MWGEIIMPFVGEPAGRTTNGIMISPHIGPRTTPNQEDTNMSEELFQILGWIGGIAFAVSALPQVVLCIRQKHADGISMLLIILMLIGSSCMAAFSVWNQITNGGQLPLLINFSLTFVLWLVIFYFKLFRNKGTHV